ncbi:unnamed protein product [Tuber aestivum]|uniref:Uncharacterized protein n=1 Tax=Tuber aestivum TaxID=59557 RepID=A0A292Q7N5_9PEZI|nr:unnamed protein product [Tuber aestivum]
MSGIYYVYMKWTRENNPTRTDWGRHLLTFESRWAADEAFRGLQGLKTAAGAKRFTTLKRVNPQFWCYDSVDGDPWWTIVYVQRENKLPELNYTLMSVILADANAGRDWPVISNPTIGRDWITGGSYYIRNRRQPNLYWYREGVRIVISTNRRTQFRIKDVDFDDERVLIKKDEVTIEPLNSLGHPTGDYVVKNGDGQKLSVGATRQVWDFSDLFDGVGVTWTGEDGSSSDIQFATSLPDVGDEWELC